MSNRFYAYFPPDENGGQHEYCGGRTVLFRYFRDQLQILGIDCGPIEPKDKRLKCFNRLLEEIPLEIKPVVKRDVRLKSRYDGEITFLQDKKRVSVEPAESQL